MSKVEETEIILDENTIRELAHIVFFELMNENERKNKKQ